MKALIFNKRMPHSSKDAPDVIWMSQDKEVMHFLSKEVFEPGVILLPNGFMAIQPDDIPLTIGYKVLEVLQQSPQGKKWRCAIENYEPFFCTVRVEAVDLAPYAKLVKKYNKTNREFDISIQPVGIDLVHTFEAYRQLETVPA